MRGLLLILIFIPFFLFYEKAQAVTYICPENKIFDLQITKSGNWLINGRKGTWENKNKVIIKKFDHQPNWTSVHYFKSCSNGFYVSALRKRISGKTNGYCKALKVGSREWGSCAVYCRKICYLSSVSKTTDINKKSILNLAFNSWSSVNRKKIQKALSEFEYYDGSIDGIYGSRTKSAIEAYTKSLRKQDHLKSEKLAKELLQSLLSSNEQPLVEEKEKKKGLF